MPLTETDLEKVRLISREEASRVADTILDSNPFDPQKQYQSIKNELAKELGESAIKQATWIVVNGIRAVVILVVSAFAAWLFDLYRWFR